jgi:hypothetical protein
MESNKSIRKFNKDTPESLARDAERQFVEDELNDARNKVIRRLFDFVATYNDELDRLRESIGDKESEVKLNNLFKPYLVAIDDAKVKLMKGESLNLDDIVKTYNSFTSELSNYTNLSKLSAKSINTKPFIEGLKTTATDLENLLEMALSNLGVKRAEFVKAYPSVYLPQTQAEINLDASLKARNVLDELSIPTETIARPLLAPGDLETGELPSGSQLVPVGQGKAHGKAVDAGKMMLIVKGIASLLRGHGKAHGKAHGRGKEEDNKKLEDIADNIVSLIY